MKISVIAYQKYQMHWALEHGVTLTDINAAASGWFNERLSDPDDDTSFCDYVFDHGFGEDSLWACYDEFFEAEYRNKEYMQSLLTKEEYMDYLRDVLTEARVELTFSSDELIALGFLNEPCDDDLVRCIHEIVRQEEKLPKKEFEIETPIGQIQVKEMLDLDYPGVSLAYIGSNESPGCIMEYNPEERIVQLRIYGKEDPDGDPLLILSMSEYTVSSSLEEVG